MPERYPIAGALGLCRKAGALLFGAERVGDAVNAGKAKLVLLTSDASPRTAKRFADLCAGRVPCKTLPLTAAELGALTPRPAAVYAVTDQNFARLCGKYLSDPER